MKKVIIIGCPGSGKSTFGRKLKSVTGLPLYHLDMMYWNKDKTTVDKSVFLNKLKDVMNEPEWIIDGNYSSTMELRIIKSDTVFFLDYPVEVCLEGIKSRAGKPRSDMPWVENDCSDKEFIDFVTNFNQSTRPMVVDLLKKYSSKNIIIFTSREQANQYISSIIL